MRQVFVLVMVLLFVVACNQQVGKTVVVASNPFVGGSQGLVVSFQDFRGTVFDGGTDPFDVVVAVENKGESLVSKGDVFVQLSGFNPHEFSKDASSLRKSPSEDVIEFRRDPQGRVIPPPRSYVEFTGLKYSERLAGGQAEFPVRAQVCYTYSTRAVSKLCVRSNLLTPQPGGICELNEEKQVFNSGAPIQVKNFRQSTRARDKVGFTFEVVNVGKGDVFERNSDCDRSVRQNENRVYVKVGTGIFGVQCTGLESTSNGAEGFVTLYGGSKIISCTQSIVSTGDFEQLVNVEVIYDYEARVQTTLKVQTSGQAD